MSATLLAVSPQRRPFNRQVIRDANLGFEILSDTGNRLAKAFGLAFTLSGALKEVYKSFNLDLERINGDDSWVLAMPARYVVDRHGVIRFADVNPDYTVRTEPEETLAELKRLKEGNE
ncbi:redoxin domain-containing protein [Pseudodesulfovibrio hydrargyri]|uniref:redoxin domain-containing protein n=1 Tax=Pseudodesulfovibrio hydrargyri TaxID=2125990 RepID=UPI0035323BAA